MSAGERQVSFEELAAQLQVVKTQIEDLQAYLAQLESNLRSIETAKMSVEGVDKAEGSIFVPGDPSATVFLIVEVKDKEKVLTHIGLNVYALLSKDKAVKILSEKESSLKTAIERVRSELEKLVKAYEQYSLILQSALATRQGRGQRG